MSDIFLFAIYLLVSMLVGLGTWSAHGSKAEGAVFAFLTLTFLTSFTAAVCGASCFKGAL